ncbi:DUF4190 domain-containing protein [Streptomyces qinzhouensis]|uniref:DUF4190 domain-containing protein n=1 Tax=Streptomyces qinzhouensis TaxID=2599401 RepID=A0A5B8IMW2_9ACTN|nr:DUF4190 domain-containing protein [Streptomyces qinzhouensis]QDY78839.1 DUF4190 domain-containing protein [Streptomyces qinzhouensis]
MDPSQQQPGPEQQPGDRTPEPGHEQVSERSGGPGEAGRPATADDPFAKPGPFGRDRAESAPEQSGPAGPTEPSGHERQPGPAGEQTPPGPAGQPAGPAQPGQPAHGGPFVPFGQPYPAQAGQHPAYHPYQQFPGYPAPPPQPTTNGFSIAALVSGLVCCMPPLGLVLGVVALRQIKRRGQRGKGMAIAGIALSAVSTLLVALFFATGAANDFWKEVEKAADEAASYQTVGDLRKGDCYNLPGANSDGTEVSEIQVVDCAKPHEGETTGGFKLTGYDEFPGDSVLEPVAERRCDDIDTAYAMDAWAIPATMSGYYYIPTKESWKTGDRRVSCGYATEGSRKTTGSIRRDADGLNENQTTYLTAENKLLRAGYEEPEKDYPQAVAGHLAWAKVTSAAMGEAAAGLRGRTWPGAVATAVEKRAAEFDKARAAWNKAAVAKDEDTFWEHVFEAEAALNVKSEKTIRQALNLSTTEPVQDEERA